jgi:hypothetical protein
VFNSSHGGSNGSNCLPHPAEQARPLLLVRREFLETKNKTFLVKQVMTPQSSIKKDT